MMNNKRNRRGATGPMIEVNESEILNSIKETEQEYKGGEIVVCPRCGDNFLLHPDMLGKYKQIFEIVKHFRENKCPHCDITRVIPKYNPRNLEKLQFKFDNGDITEMVYQQPKGGWLPPWMR